ncbi:hypothetical protein QTL97_09755 [Sporosarcina thermotolerans]|uniref:Uncharacterized protein n=1 Tax=Sporosarcina thermotolerans TaxID=633404 RepID=A0AAW9ADJ9_9BACL|nr:hypothetical protein [Sporosarcina thermotolerans]MDW0117221.1 hypothetical protein [Sporosarcina thermotolerans]WHT47392.1 hypothetical protein QNH10_14470 [Sporosarcina thermotolerans]
MRFLYLLLILLLFVLAGCSSASLSDAIDKDGRINVEILFQDDIDKVVLFLNEDYSGQPMLSLNTFTKEDSRYIYNAGGEFAQNVNITNQFKIIKLTPVGHSSIIALWGGVFNYPNATTVSYVLKDDEDNEIYRSKVKITDNIVYEKLPDGIYEQAKSFHYKILDGKNNVIVEW